MGASGCHIQMHCRGQVGLAAFIYTCQGKDFWICCSSRRNSSRSSFMSGTATHDTILLSNQTWIILCSLCTLATFVHSAAVFYRISVRFRSDFSDFSSLFSSLIRRLPMSFCAYCKTTRKSRFSISGWNKFICLVSHKCPQMKWKMRTKAGSDQMFDEDRQRNRWILNIKFADLCQEISRKTADKGEKSQIITRKYANQAGQSHNHKVMKQTNPCCWNAKSGR